MIIIVIFWISVSLILHTYVVYPVLLYIIGALTGSEETNLHDGYHPAVSVLMAAHNEEDVIREKTDALFTSSYQTEIIIGSDASTDRTNLILDEMRQQHPELKIIKYKERLGKPVIINQLSELASGEILIITDANVIPEKDTIANIIRNFSDKSVGLTDSRIVNRNTRKDGISAPEVVYNKIESSLKHTEGLLWGTMMGPFGGFYADNVHAYTKIVSKYIA